MKIEHDGLIIREFPSHLENIEYVDEFVANVGSKFNIDDQKLFDIHVALTEAVNNAMIHGNILNDDKTVILSCVHLTGRLVFTIKDQGSGFNMDECYKDPTCKEKIEQPNGRGIFLIQRLADRVTFMERGRVVEIEFSI